MVEPRITSAETNLRHLEGKSFEGILHWLEQALHGRETLPSVVPGESPEIPILRRERELSHIARQDLRTASLTLVRRYVKSPVGKDDAFVAALLRLATGFVQEELVTDLHALAVDAERFGTLPEMQIRSVLFALLDLKAQLASEFWRNLVERLPAGSKVIPVTALLRHGPRSTSQILPVLPSEEAIADSLYVILDQHAGNLNSDELAKLIALLRQVIPDCQPEIQIALQEWCSDRGRIEEAPSRFPEIRRLALDSALASHAAKHGKTYSREPASPKLVRPIPA